MNAERPGHTRILEGILTTVAPQPAGAPLEQRVNIAPMGPILDDAMSRLILRPFTSSTTYRNLKATGEGVFHVTDDVLMMARAAVGNVEAGVDAPVRPAAKVVGRVLADACRFYELKVVEMDDSQDRTRIVAAVVHGGRLRDFFGFNRAKHAVLEAAILATRLHLTGAKAALEQFHALQQIVDKTGADAEQQAMAVLWDHVREWEG